MNLNMALNQQTELPHDQQREAWGKTSSSWALLCVYAPWRKPHQYSNFQPLARSILLMGLIGIFYELEPEGLWRSASNNCWRIFWLNSSPITLPRPLLRT
jgi:hypothetical protein